MRCIIIFLNLREVYLVHGLLGVSGSYEGNDLVPCGHTFSDMKKYNSTTAQNDCIDMIERILSYWMEQAKSYT